MLTYEKKKELNIGTSIGMFNNRLAIDVDYYTRKQHDLIGEINTQGLGGQISKYGNIAKMNSHGLELSVSGTILRNEDFSWNSSFIFTRAVNKITEMENHKQVVDLISGNGFGLQDIR